MTEFDQDAAERILDGVAGQDAMPEGYGAVRRAIEEVRSLSASEDARDPVSDQNTVRAMAGAVSESRSRDSRLRRRFAPPRLRVAVATAAIAVLGTAGVAAAGGPDPVAGVAELIGQVEDQEDLERDLEDLAEDAAEREAEGLEPLPDEAAAGRQGADENRAAALDVAASVRAWTACVASAAAAHEASGETAAFNPVAACGKHPAHQEAPGIGKDDEAVGPDADQPPAGAGPPQNAGPPSNAGPPENAGPPGDAGLPEDAGPPANAGPTGLDLGPPADAGPSPSAGPPAGAGRPPGAGPPPSAGPPPNAGPPAGTQAPSNPGSGPPAGLFEE